MALHRETLETFTIQDKLELMACLMRLIQAEVSPAKHDVRQQGERLAKLRSKLAAMPTAAVTGMR